MQRVTDGMAHSIVRLQRELDEANARIALLEEEQKILATARLDQSHFGRTVAKAAVTEGGIGNSGAERPEPSPHFYERRFREVHEANARIAGELVKAREEAKRATYDAAQETIKVSTVKSHWIEACRERDEAREKAERYRLEANAMMAQRDEAKRKVAELQAGLDDIEEYGTEEINAAVDLRHQLAAALVECDKLKSEKEANHQCLLMLERDIYKAREDRDKAISVAERLIDYAHECLVKLESWGQGYQRYEDDMDRIREDIAAYNMMKDSLK